MYDAANKDHYSLSCPPPFTIFKQFETDLKPYEVSKSAIRFPLDTGVPTKLIGRQWRSSASKNTRTRQPRNGS